MYYYLCYEGGVNLNDIKDPNEMHALQVQIMEFGQMPKKIFENPHPTKMCLLINDFKQFGSYFFINNYYNNIISYMVITYNLYYYGIIQFLTCFLG